MRKYEYMPEDFEDKGGFDEDLRGFYRLLEQYNADKTPGNRGLLRNEYEIVFYSLKHRVLEGFITEDAWNDVNKYLGGLVNG